MSGNRIRSILGRYKGAEPMALAVREEMERAFRCTAEEFAPRLEALKAQGTKMPAEVYVGVFATTSPEVRLHSHIDLRTSGDRQNARPKGRAR